jgi:hypothetical protein
MASIFDSFVFAPEGGKKDASQKWWGVKAPLFSVVIARYHCAKSYLKKYSANLSPISIPKNTLAADKYSIALE